MSILIGAASLTAALGSTGQLILAILVSVLALMIMVIVHEAGHYTAGKLLKFKINEFSIGFGPKLFSRKAKSGELFSVRALPLGGFCAFLGEDEDVPSPDAFNSQKPWKRIIVLLAGVTFNFISSIIILLLVFMIYGYTVPQVNETFVSTDSTVQNFEVGDQILKVNGKNVYTFVSSNLTELFTESGDDVTVTVCRDGEVQDITVHRGEFNYVVDGVSEVGTGFGIITSLGKYRYGFFGSMGRAALYSVQIISLIFQTIGGMITGAIGIKNNLGGPITTIAVMSSTIINLGFPGILSIFGIMSASIAVMNVLPLPALDGSRVVFTVIEWIRGKPINRKVEGMIHTVGFFVLIALTVLFDLFNIGNLASYF